MQILYTTLEKVKCPHCVSEQIQKNGHRRGKQNYRCKECDRQFIESYSQRGYSDEVRQVCVRMYQQGMGTREIEKFTGICHSTVYNWLRQVG